MNIDLERKKLELVKVEAAKYELEFKIKERMADIQRIKENILIQDKKINELNSEIATMEG